MAKQPSIECSRCKGRIGLSWKGQTLDDALERHERLTHGPGPAPRPLPVVQQTKVLRRRVVKTAEIG